MPTTLALPQILRTVMATKRHGATSFIPSLFKVDFGMWQFISLERTLDLFQRHESRLPSTATTVALLLPAAAAIRISIIICRETCPHTLQLLLKHETFSASVYGTRWNQKEGLHCRFVGAQPS